MEPGHATDTAPRPARTTQPAAIGLLLLALGLALGRTVFAFRPPVWGEPPGPMEATRWFGLDRLALVPGPLRVLGVVLPLLALLFALCRSEALRVAARRAHAGLARPAVRLGVGALSGMAFYTLASQRPNLDGRLLMGKIPLDVARIGTHVTHDELWELHLHARAWFHLHRAFGLDVAGTYRWIAALAGSVFVVLLLDYVRRLDVRAAAMVTLGLLGSGVAPLFFGDVENYGLATSLAFAYLVAAHAYLDGRVPLVLPAALLATAGTFHAVTGLLLPSLSVLFAHALTHGRIRDLIVSAAAGLTIVGGTLAYFHVHGLPIGRLFDHSHLFAQGGHYGRYVTRWDGPTAWSMAQLALLAVPFVFLTPFARPSSAPWERAFERATWTSAVVFFLGYRAQLGAYDDWNLYAVSTLGITHAVARGLARRPRDRVGDAAIALFLASGATHTLAWVLANHRS